LQIHRNDRRVDMRRKEDDEELVFSTEEGDLRTKSSKGSGKRKRSASQPPAEATDGVARVRREKKGRGGKTVTAVYGLDLDESELKELGKRIKQACGTGGSVKGGVIEIQGDMTEAVLSHLKGEGYAAKRGGG
jgi:translation initiation factor 1